MPAIVKRVATRCGPFASVWRHLTLLATFVQVDINKYVNANLVDYTNGSDYPPGGTALTVGGVPFTLANHTGGGTGVVQTPYQSQPNSFDVPVSIANPSVVYTLINSTYGTLGDTVGSVEFKATGGLDYAVNLVEGQDIRDHNNDGYNNTIGKGDLGGIYNATADFAGGQVRLDEQRFILPTSFQSATLTDIILHGTGHYPIGNPFLAAATATSARIPTITWSNPADIVYGRRSVPPSSMPRPAYPAPLPIRRPSGRSCGRATDRRCQSPSRPPTRRITPPPAAW